MSFSTRYSTMYYSSDGRSFYDCWSRDDWERTIQMNGFDRCTKASFIIQNSHSMPLYNLKTEEKQTNKKLLLL